jgi:hypothetical protein
MVLYFRPILSQISDLADPKHESDPMARTLEMRDLQAREIGLRQEIAAIQTEHGHQARIEAAIEQIEPEIDAARKRLKEAKKGYGRTLENLTCSRTEEDLQETRQRAQEIVNLVAKLSKTIPSFWEAHASLREGATKAGAQLNRGAGVGLDAKRVDGVLHAMLWPIFGRSMHNVRPGPGTMDATLTDLFPSSLRQYLGEAEVPETPKKKAKNTEGGGLAA